MRALFTAFLLAFPVCMAQQPGPVPGPTPPAPGRQEVQEPAQQEPEGQPAQRIEVPMIPPMQDAEIPVDIPQGLEAEYRGPTILSRGGQPSVQRAAELFRIVPFATIEGIYDTGIATVGVDQAGRIPYTDAYGVQATFGATGARAFQHSSLALDYRGGIRHYTNESYYDGFDNTLLLRYENQVSRRWIVSVTQGAASLSHGAALPFGVTQAYDPMFGTLTGSELFDTRTSAFLTSGQAVYLHTPRLSFSMGAAGFLVRRRSSALIGSNGFMAIGDVAYRVGRRSTVALEYDFSQYVFQHQFGSSYMHGLAVDYARRLSRWWELSVRAGGVRAETSRLQAVLLDPAVAAILGQTMGISVFNGATYLPQYAVRLTRTFRRSFFSAAYSRIVSPGNGVYLTATNEFLDVSYATQASRDLAFGAGAATTRMKGLTQNINSYRGYTARAGVTFRVLPSVSFITRFDVRSQRVGGTLLDRESYRAAVGFGWTPGEYPVSVW